MKEKIQKLLTKIQEFQTIIVFRHDAPDFDAYGSQYGLATFLKDNFPRKRILITGNSNVEVGHDLYPVDTMLSDEEINKEPFLALIVDTSEGRRVSDQRYKKAAYSVRLDHHPGEAFCDLEFVNTESSAASELIYFLLSELKDYHFTKESSRHLIIGIVGDTGAFKTSNTTQDTFHAIGDLLEYGVNLISDVYQPMFARTMIDFEAERFIMENYKLSPKGVAYYFLDQKDLIRFGLDSDEAKKYLSIFDNVIGIKEWVCFADDARKHEYRVSLRSSKYKVSDVARLHGGGGHDLAAGAKAKNKEEALQIIKELDERL